MFGIMILSMRTTATLEPETERLFREAMRQRGQSFEEVLNQAVVQGMADLRCDAGEAPFAPHAFPMGLRAGYDPVLPRLELPISAGTMIQAAMPHPVPA